MVRGVNGLPPEKRSALMAAQVDVMSGLSSEERTKMMEAMDAAMTETA